MRENLTKGVKRCKYTAYLELNEIIRMNESAVTVYHEGCSRWSFYDVTDTAPRHVISCQLAIDPLPTLCYQL